MLLKSFKCLEFMNNIEFTSQSRGVSNPLCVFKSIFNEEGKQALFVDIQKYVVANVIGSLEKFSVQAVLTINNIIDRFTDVIVMTV